MNKIKISVIIPVYNCEQYLARCFDGIKSQTFTDFETILVDDGSTDKSAEIIKEFCKTQSNAKLFTIKHGGRSGLTRNKGLDEACGDYIVFVDGDDIISPNYLNKLYELVEKNNADIACAEYAKNRTSDFEQLSDSTKILDSKKAVNSLLKMEIKNGPVVKIFRRNIIGKTRMPDYTVAEDLYFNYEVFQKAQRIAVNDSVIYSYITNQDSQSTRAFTPERMGSLEAVKMINTSENSFYSKARLFMEAYFICESIILSKSVKKYPAEYCEVYDIMMQNRKDILNSDKSSKRQKLTARLLVFGPTFAVNILTFKRRLRVK